LIRITSRVDLAMFSAKSHAHSNAHPHRVKPWRIQFWSWKKQI